MKKIISMLCAVILGAVLVGCAAQDALRDQAAQKIQDQVDKQNAARDAAKAAKLKKAQMGTDETTATSTSTSTKPAAASSPEAIAPASFRKLHLPSVIVQPKNSTTTTTSPATVAPSAATPAIVAPPTQAPAIGASQTPTAIPVKPALPSQAPAPATLSPSTPNAPTPPTQTQPIQIPAATTTPADAAATGDTTDKKDLQNQGQ